MHFIHFKQESRKKWPLLHVYMCYSKNDPINMRV